MPLKPPGRYTIRPVPSHLATLPARPPTDTLLLPSPCLLLLRLPHARNRAALTHALVPYLSAEPSFTPAPYPKCFI